MRNIKAKRVLWSAILLTGWAWGLAVAAQPAPGASIDGTWRWTFTMPDGKLEQYLVAASE